MNIYLLIFIVIGAFAILGLAFNGLKDMISFIVELIKAPFTASKKGLTKLDAMKNVRNSKAVIKAIKGATDKHLYGTFANQTPAIQNDLKVKIAKDTKALKEQKDIEKGK